MMLRGLLKIILPLGGLPETPMPRIPEVPEVPEIPEDPEIPELPEVPKIPEVQFSTLSGRIWGPFPSFFEVPSRERLNSQRTGPNLCFC